MKAEKNYSDETKHRQSPIQTHHTKSEITKPSFQEKERLWTPLCAQFTDRTQLLEAAPSVAMSCQVLLNGCIFSLCFSCHRKLPSTSQANYPLPIELHSWIIIIDFWSSVINVLKMCLHSQLSNTIKEVLPETGFGLSCLHPIFAPGYIKWLLQFGPAFPQIRHVGSINNILKHWPAQLPLHTTGLCFEPSTAWGQTRAQLQRKPHQQILGLAEYTSSPWF